MHRRHATFNQGTLASARAVLIFLGGTLNENFTITLSIDLLLFGR